MAGRSRITSSSALCAAITGPGSDAPTTSSSRSATVRPPGLHTVDFVISSRHPLGDGAVAHHGRGQTPPPTIPAVPWLIRPTAARSPTVSVTVRSSAVSIHRPAFPPPADPRPSDSVSHRSLTPHGTIGAALPTTELTGAGGTRAESRRDRAKTGQQGRVLRLSPTSFLETVLPKSTHDVRFAGATTRPADLATWEHAAPRRNIYPVSPADAGPRTTTQRHLALFAKD